MAQADGDTDTTSHGINGRGPLHHAHIVFSRGYVLPIVGESDNVGYHAVHGASGPGELFKENVKSKGYSIVSQLSDSEYDDRLLIIDSKY